MIHGKEDAPFAEPSKSLYLSDKDSGLCYQRTIESPVKGKGIDMILPCVLEMDKTHINLASRMQMDPITTSNVLNRNSVHSSIIADKECNRGINLMFLTAAVTQGHVLLAELIRPSRTVRRPHWGSPSTLLTSSSKEKEATINNSNSVTPPFCFTGVSWRILLLPNCWCCQLVRVERDTPRYLSLSSSSSEEEEETNKNNILSLPAVWQGNVKNVVVAKPLLLLPTTSRWARHSALSLLSSSSEEE